MKSVPGAIATGSTVDAANGVSTGSGSDRVATGLQVSLLDRCETLTLVWNDTDIPLAYLITFRCYGTWLHGDKRGSIDRVHNRYKSPYIEPNQRWHRHNTRALEGQPIILGALQRKSVERAIRETCELRRWHLHSLNVRTNHVHAVVCIGSLKPERALTAFKANSTKRMRQDGCWLQDSTPWAEKGSKRYL